MIIRVELEAYVHLPEGTTVPERGRAFTLPNGDWVKPFVVLEMNDWHDLSHGDMMKLGVLVKEANIQWFEVE